MITERVNQMTAYELAKRDFDKAEGNFERAKRKKNIPQSELEHLEELCKLRKTILERIMENDKT